MKLLRKKQKERNPVPDMTYLELEDVTIPVRFRQNARARRMILRVEAPRGDGNEEGGAVVTLPRGVNRSTALQFVEERAHWILERLDQAPNCVRFTDGAKMPFLGVEHVIRHQRDQRPPVVQHEGVLSVGGRPEHLARRLSSWLKKEARRHIEAKVVDLSELINKRHGRITIRDTRSRWGSCSSNGALSFSWRLVMAPEWVLEYVVAHEVAHLVEHNHSPAFWAVVATLNGDAGRAKDWLTKYGETLHHYG